MAKVIRLPVVEKARKKAGKPEPIPYQWTCRRCKADIGVETSLILTMTAAPRIKGLKVVGGSKIKVCAYCWKRGVHTEVF